MIVKKGELKKTENEGIHWSAVTSPVSELHLGAQVASVQKRTCPSGKSIAR